MGHEPAILLIDDGELHLVRELLDGLEVEYAEESSAKCDGPTPQPSALLVTTSRVALSRGLARGPSEGPRRPVWIAFLAGNTKSQRSPLERAGFDFLVREPVHPAALRLLLLHALVQGDDKRSAPRLAFGYGVRIGGRLRKRRATLTDLSTRGCRLLTRHSLEVDARVRLVIPSEAAGGKALRLCGAVVRSAPGHSEGGDSGETSLGIRFESMSSERKKRLYSILRERARGPAVLADPAPGRGSGSHKNVRLHPRVEFSQEMSAVASSNAHVVLGHDLSQGGMRIEAHDQISVGDDLFMAIQSSSGADSFFVEGRVLRDDGERGLGLKFEWVEPGAIQKLDELVSALPVIENLSSEGASGGTVIVQWLSTLVGRSAD